MSNETEKCSYKFINESNEERTCGEESYLDGQDCVFHSSNNKKKNDFEEKFRQKFPTSGYGGPDTLYFNGFIFPEISMFTLFKGEKNKASINKVCIFKDSKFTKIVNFTKCKFAQDVDFTSCIFEGDAFFNDMRFSKNIFFKKCIFKGETKFDSTHFEPNISFEDAQFQGVTSFKNTNFIKQSSFQSASFEKLVEFDHTNFNEKVTFDEVKFQGKLKLEYISIQTPIDFVKCQIHQLDYKVHTGNHVITFNQFSNLKKDDQLGELNFKDQNCSNIAFLNSNLSRANFLGADIRDTRFDTCNWRPDKKGTKYTQLCGHEEIVKKLKSESLEENSDPKLLQSLYLQLKKRYDESHDYHQSGDFHYQEMDLRLKLLQKEKESSLKWFNPLLYVVRLYNFCTPDIFLMNIYRWVADFGENYIKLFLWFIASIIVASLLILFSEYLDINTSIKNLLEMVGDQINTSLKNGILKFYLAFKKALIVIIPTAISKSDLFKGMPTTSKIIVILEGIINIILLALFVMSIRRKFRR